MSADDCQPCPNWDDHIFEETYYGHCCKKCSLFYAHGCAPWDDEDGLIEDYEDEPQDYVGCLFPDKCVMPGEYLVSECCTAEMMEQMETNE